MAEVILKKGEGRTIKAGGFWIYDNEIDRIVGDFTPGDMVRVLDFDGYPMGVGFINPRSRIEVRLMTRDANAVIDEAFFRMRVANAWQYRKDVMDDTSCCRLIFGEADFLPGLTVDKYEDVLVVESLALGIDRWKLKIIDLLKEVLLADGISIRGVYERSDAKVRELEGLPRCKGFIGPEFDTKIQITENGVRYMVDVEDGQKTGFFLDQKYNRRAIGRLCRGARVLDCFTHTGSFALNAAYCGAREVTGVDASELGITQARENAALNGWGENADTCCGANAPTVRFEVADIFDYLPALEEAGEQYDVVILDPPAFTKSRETIKKAAKGYREINLRGMRLVRDGGYLATCSCSHFMDNDLFLKTIEEAARGAHVKLRLVESRRQAPDHPVLMDGSENSMYLKFYIFQVLK